MADKEFKVKNGISMDNGILRYNSSSSAWEFSNNNGSSFAEFGSGGSEVTTTEVTTTTISTASATEVYSFSPSTYDAAELNITVRQGSKRTALKALANHDGSTTAKATSYGILTHGSPSIPLTIDATYNAAGTTWTTRAATAAGSTIRSVAYGNDTWVAVAYSGRVSTSTDAITWTTRTAVGTLQFVSVEYGGGVWVAGAYNGIYARSTDAITWVTYSSISSDSPTWYGLTYANSTWLIGGAYDTRLHTSTDAITWVTRTSNFGNTGITSSDFGNNLWAVGGYKGELRTSTDTVTWTTRTSNFGNTAIRAIAYGNSLWVAAGESGQLRSSTDAITWTTRTSNFATNIRITDCTYTGGVWIAVGYGGNIRTSTDTITWVTRTPSHGTGQIFSVDASSSRVCAVGYNGDGNNAGSIRTSEGTSLSVTATITDANTTSATVKVLPTLMEA